MINKKEASDVLQYYAAGFVDLLGQAEILAQIDDLPDQNNPADVARFVDLAKRSFLLVDSFHKAFERQHAAFSKESDFVKNLPPDQRRPFSLLRSRPVSLQRYADGISMFHSLKITPEEPALVAISSLWGLLAGCTTNFLYFLSQGHPLRGGIDLGLGLEMKEGFLYGPAAHRAYVLESKCAQHPRVVVGDRVLKYLDDAAKQYPEKGASPEQALLTNGVRISALRCKRLLFADVDGRIALDYLGEESRALFELSGYTQLAHRAFAEVEMQLKSAQEKKDYKLVSRYLIMRDYFSKRLPAWKNEHKPAS